MARILIVHDSRYGNTAAMARQIARGVHEVADAEAVVRLVPAIEVQEDRADDSGPLEADVEELRTCDALILGSPAHFGNMSAATKHFLDQTVPIWMSGALVGKPAGVFTSTGSLHGGQESTLLSMMLPLLHHGMVLVGLPYTNAELTTTMSGGTPYGPTHVAGVESDRPLTTEEKSLCRALGRRVAEIAGRLT